MNETICPACAAAWVAPHAPPARPADVDIVGAWLLAECRAGGLAAERVRGVEVPGGEIGASAAFGRALWRVTGGPPAAGPDAFALEVAVAADAPGVAAVRVVTAEAGQLPDEALHALARSLAGRAAQLHEERGETWGAAAGLAPGGAGGPFTRWGAEQVLAVGPLVPGLLAPVAARLLAAARAAAADRRAADPAV